MTGNQLFAQLVQRFQNYSDAAVLWILLKEEADKRDYQTTAWSMAAEQLCQTISPKTVQRSFRHLTEMGFVTVRTHKNTRTHIAVHQEAVLEFLRQPMATRLPAMSQKQFAFLDAWATDSRPSAAPGESGADVDSRDPADQSTRH
ncbi:hypothetical protein AVME950_00575 [Acidovorax sp. SUPP950]|uniref:hypothetical protein n=1 Tax=Acidovorax sp. SUPP950 TaxID=511901 RepID=UPI0023CA02AF|nr:hypothetical protein [Acidovorax sp. SUPP950]GKS73333.1 hypothetical protein AVME950_00575 [Acidovorax sp. SUPP950]